MESSKKYLAVCFTMSGTIRFHRFLRNNNIPAEVKPVPRTLSTCCAIGIEFFYAGEISLLTTQDIKQIYLHQDNQYIVKYGKNH